MQLSYVKGPDSPPLRDTTIGAALCAAAEQWPDQEAVVAVHQGIRWTYAELHSKAQDVAEGLLGLGLAKGDRVGIWSPNNAEWALSQFATAKAGLVLVNINPAYRLSELEFTLNKVGVKALITPRSFKTSEYVRMVEELVPEIASGLRQHPSARIPSLEHVIQIGGDANDGWLRFDAIPDQATDASCALLASLQEQLDCHDPINIQFTSGTTGLPKGATLSHYNILNNGFFVGEAIGLKEGDKLCIPVPLYHCFGMVMGNLGCLTHGATMVYPSEIFDPGAVLATVQKERCAGLYGVPSMFISELSHPEFATFDLSSLRTGCMAGSPCPVEIMRQVIDRMHMQDVTIAYGMTETSPVSFQTGSTDSLERKVSTIGKVHPHLECKIVDEAGNTVPTGQPGEFCTRGYSVMIGYWDDTDKTAEALDAEGWMHTGDLATIDDAGYGNIVGRIKDMIIRGGENVYPREIEEFLYRHPDIEDVAVVGVPDAKYGEEICACIKPAAGKSVAQADVKDFCKGQIAHYKVPRYVVTIDELPMTVTGKIQKFVLRDQMIARLGLKV